MFRESAPYFREISLPLSGSLFLESVPKQLNKPNSHFHCCVARGKREEVLGTRSGVHGPIHLQVIRKFHLWGEIYAWAIRSPKKGLFVN